MKWIVELFNQIKADIDGEDTIVSLAMANDDFIVLRVEVNVQGRSRRIDHRFLLFDILHKYGQSVTNDFTKNHIAKEIARTINQKIGEER